VPKRFLFRDNFDRRQVPLNRKECGFRHIASATLGREASGVRGTIQHGLGILVSALTVFPWVALM
jgi:hypothetical protein